MANQNHAIVCNALKSRFQPIITPHYDWLSILKISQKNRPYFI